jgi:transposase-like protein
MARHGRGERVKGPERDGGKERFWRDMVRRWRRSGAPVRDFCAEHGLSEPSFYGWRRTIAERDERAARRTVDRGVRAAAVELPAFVPVQVASAPATSALEVVVATGRVVRVPPGFDAPTLRSLLAVLEEAPPC